MPHNLYPELDDQQAHALGILTWEGVKLEGLIERICEIIVPGSTHNRSAVSTHAQNVEKFIVTGPNPSRAQMRAREWLAQSRHELERRNITLHVIVEARYVWNGSRPEFRQIGLVNTRYGKGGLPALTTRSDISALSFYGHADSLRKVSEAWSDIEIGLVTDV